ncbi:hypothetical protein ACNOYE_30130 [Nannocystaceae bacterium ST9]
MRAPRIALFAAVLVALASLAFALVRLSADPPPTHDMHRHFRVELDVPPVEAALWFAAHYPKYFTSGEAGLDAWLDGLAPNNRDFVLALGQTLTWAWVEHELAGFESEDPKGLAREATVAIRHETLNQLELNVAHFPDVAGIEFNAWVGDPGFAGEVFARLIRGVSNCEGQNHLVAILLDTALESKVLGVPGIDALMIGIEPGHELVRLRGPTLEQAIYVDAWSNLPPFTLDSLASLGDSPPPVVPGVASRPPFSASIYAEASETRIEPLSDRHAPTRTVDLEIRAPALDEASLAKLEDPWKLYLYARILHVYDDPRAGDLYRMVLARHCESRRFVCEASRLLLERL